MASYVKKTTGLLGLAVAKNPRQSLITVYNKTLEVLQRIPKDATYRTHVEKITSERLQMVEQENNVEVLENKIGAGQIEEVLKQAEDELSLAKKMEEWRPWEPLEEAAPAGQWKWPA